jgi:hypothetical protein
MGGYRGESLALCHDRPEECDGRDGKCNGRYDVLSSASATNPLPNGGGFRSHDETVSA